MENQYIIDVKKLNTVIVSNKETVHIIKDISFKLKKGHILAFVGESGCGKSMTVNSIMKIVPKSATITAEHIIYNDIDQSGKVIKEYHIESMNNTSKDIREIRGSKISMIFQDPMVSLNPVYKVGDQIIEGLLEHNPQMKKKEAKELAIEMLKKLEIPAAEDRINDYPHQFSGGMKQRIVIAIALINNPDVIIADEPTTALDVTIQAQILDLLKVLQRESKKSILLITHNMGIVADMANEVAIMYMGRIVEYGTIEDIFKNPLHPYTKALLESVPVLSDNIKKLTTIPGNTPSPAELTNKIKCEFEDRCQFCKEECRYKKIPLYKVDNEHVVRCLLFDTYEEVNEDGE